MRWISIGLLAVALLAVFSPNILSNPTMINVYFGLMIVGVFISSVGSHLTSRYGRSPRPDELLDKAFKGLDDKFSILHYKSSIAHLMIGPAGLWSLIPSYVDGVISYNKYKKMWVRKGGSFINKFLSREAFGRPDKELIQNQKDLQKILKSIGYDDKVVLKCAVILLNKNTIVEENDNESEILILPFEKAKEKFRKLSKAQIEIPPELINALSE
ncbi:MAG: hypothetical protein HGB14_01080 [Anaerolineaceae bacterium]|nr:hypothetical protein [Anaerolineaceae bacterium]